MVGRGLLSQLLARPEVDISNPSNLLTGGVVSGRITSSLLSFIPGQVQETVEIRLKFVTMQRASQIASLMSMFLYNSIQQTITDRQVSQILDGRWISELQEQGIWDHLLDFKNAVLGGGEDLGGNNNNNNINSTNSMRLSSPTRAMSPFKSSPGPFRSSPGPSSIPGTSVFTHTERIIDPQIMSELTASSPAAQHQNILVTGRAQERIDERKERRDKEQAERVAEDEMQNECYNCRTLHATSWRKCTSRDEDGLFTIVLCNPCGLWFTCKKEHRPRKLWGKMKDGRPIPPARRGPRKRADKDRADKPEVRTHNRPPGPENKENSSQLSIAAMAAQANTHVSTLSKVSRPTKAQAQPTQTLSQPVALSAQSRPDNAAPKRPFQALTQTLQQPPTFDKPHLSATRTASMPVSDRPAKRAKKSATEVIDLDNADTPVDPALTSVTPTMPSTGTMSGPPANLAAPAHSHGHSASAPGTTASSSNGTPSLQPKTLPPLPPITPQKPKLTPGKNIKTPDFLVGVSPSRWLSAFLGSAAKSPSQLDSHHNHTSPVDHNTVNFFSEGDLFTESPFRGLYQGVRSEPFNHSSIGPNMPPPFHHASNDSAEDEFNMNILPSSPSIFRMYRDQNDLFSSSSQSTDATSPINKLQQMARNSPDAHKSLEESEEIGTTNKSKGLEESKKIA